LYKVQLRYLDKLAAKSAVTTVVKTEPSPNSAIVTGGQHLERLVNQTPIGVFRPSQIGEPMRLFYYLSPLDLIHHQQSAAQFNSTYQLTGSYVSSVEQLVEHELGASLTISLHTPVGSGLPQQHNLPDVSLVLVSEVESSENERLWHELLNPCLNNLNLNFEK
jgi:hypothetical protein